MQTHAQQAVNALGPAALDLPVSILAAIQKDATEARLTRRPDRDAGHHPVQPHEAPARQPHPGARLAP